MNNYYIVFNLYLNCYFSLPFPFYGQNVIEKFKSLDSSFFIKFIYFIFGCARSFLLVVESGPYSVIVVCGLLIPAASLIVEHGRSGTRASVVAACGLSSCSSWVLEHMLGNRSSWVLEHMLGNCSSWVLEHMLSSCGTRA